MLPHKSHENRSRRRVGSRLYEWRRLWYKNESLRQQRWLYSYLLPGRSLQQWGQHQQYCKQRRRTDLFAHCCQCRCSSLGGKFVKKKKRISRWKAANISLCNTWHSTLCFSEGTKFIWDEMFILSIKSRVPHSQMPSIALFLSYQAKKCV